MFSVLLLVVILLCCECNMFSKHLGKRDSTDDGPASKKKKSLCVYLKRWEDVYTWLAPTRDNPNEARCILCDKAFSIGHGGINDVNKHNNSLKHIAKEKDSKTSKKINVCFPSAASSELNLKTVAELSLVYHTVRHGISYNSMDCCNKLIKTVFKDSEIAKSQCCGRTKAESLVINMLAPKVTSVHLAFIKRHFEKNLAVPFAVSVDASNHGNRKMFPVCLRYFNPQTGIQSFLLDFVEQADETSASIAELINKSLTEHGLNIENACAYGGDNAHVNFGKNKSVFKKLNEAGCGNLLKAGCSNHILHNAVKHACNYFDIDIETAVLKIYSHFSVSAKRRAELRDFFEFVDCEWQEILRHVTTRWLSLTPAAKRILDIWQPLSSYFKSSDCPKVLLQIFPEDDEAKEKVAKMYFSFFVNVGSFLQSVSLKLEKESISVIESHNEMISVLSNLQKRKDECWYGHEVSNLLSDLLPEERKKVECDFDGFYTKLIAYLKNSYDFDDYKNGLNSLALSKDVPVFHDFINSVKSMNMNTVDMDMLFEEYAAVKDVIQELMGTGDFSCKSVEGRWMSVFSTMKTSAPQLEKIISTVLAIPGSNASVERVFSMMNHKWSNSRNRCSTALMKSELQVCVNSKLDCQDFYNLLRSDLTLLRDARSSTKYGELSEGKM